jgi:hypothetical protein
MDPATVSARRVRASGSRLWQRLAAGCGALFALGIIVGDDMINAAGEAPSPFDRNGDSIAEVSQYLNSAGDAAANGTYWIGRAIGTLALVALLVFALHVSRMIREREPEGGLLSGLTMSGGIAAAGLGLVSCAAQFGVVARANEGINPEVARVMLDFSGIAFVLMWLPIAVFLAATAAAGLRLALLPLWLSISTAVLAVGLAIGLAAMPVSNAGFIAIVLSFLWFITASVSLVRRVGVERGTAESTIGVTPFRGPL